MKSNENIKQPDLPQKARRNFIQKLALTSGAMATAPALLASTASAGSSIEKPVALYEKRKLGSLEVTPIGLGCMSMTSGSYNPPRTFEEMEPVIRGAVDRGVNFFDTAEVYGPFTNETLVGKALKPVRDQVIIGSKFGFNFDNGRRAGRNSRPEHIRKAVEGMLKRLQTDRIDLLYMHRMDPKVPIEDIAGTVKDLIKEGKALEFGLSETSPETTRKAHAVHPVAAVQSQYSILERVHENHTLDVCEELGIGFVTWGSVGRGFLADKFNEYSRFSNDSRYASVSYFTPEAIEKHMELLSVIRKWARKKDATPAQISLAWCLAQKPFIVPIPGTTKLHNLEEDLGALEIKFSAEELSEFRDEFFKIELIGVRKPDSVLTDA